jgi:2'-5' RNA ligase
MCPVHLPRPGQPRSDTLDHHWGWRPEWTEDRPCLYWYLVFDPADVARAISSPLLATIRDTSWLEPIPLRWMHLTLCEVGFVDEVADGQVDEAVRSLTRRPPSLDVPALTLGPPAGMESAVVLGAGPRQQLQRLQDRLCSHTKDALGLTTDHPVEEDFQPHVSLGYVNRSVTAGEVQDVTAGYGDFRAVLPISGLILAEVTRNRTHYAWRVQAAVRPTPGAG